MVLRIVVNSLRTTTFYRVETFVSTALNVYQTIAYLTSGLDTGERRGDKTGMPRKLRIEYQGAIYHVMSRGDRREDIFLDDVDRQSRF
jgi:hypothetical protein